MNWLMPEPASDIRAQIDALLDKGHPKDAVFVASGNVDDVPDDIPVQRWWRPLQGLLMTTDYRKLDAFRDEMPDDAGMAAILGYPEPKDAALAACPEAWLRVVQACDWQGSVITEALCSPGWLERTQEALEPHGRLRTLTVSEVLARRFSMRCAELRSA